MSWCPPRHCPPCSSLLIMLDGASFAFVSHPIISPVFFLVIFPLLLLFFLVVFFSPPFLLSLSPGVSLSSPHTEISVTESEPCLTWHAGDGCKERQGHTLLTAEGKAPPLPLMRLLTAVSNTPCTCVWMCSYLHKKAVVMNTQQQRAHIFFEKAHSGVLHMACNCHAKVRHVPYFPDYTSLSFS